MTGNMGNANRLAATNTLARLASVLEFWRIGAEDDSNLGWSVSDVRMTMRETHICIGDQVAALAYLPSLTREKQRR